MAAKDTFLDLANTLGQAEQQILFYFCKDTTERIMMNIARLGIGECKGATGALRKSIHSVVYNNARGDEAMIRFYYLNYAAFVETATGKYYGVDRKGKKYADVSPIPPIGGSGYEPIPTKAPRHRAKPFITGEIRLHARATQLRLAKACAYTAQWFLSRGFCDSVDDETNRLRNSRMLQELKNELKLGSLDLPTL